MRDPEKWETLREQLLSTPEGRAALWRARRRMERHRRYAQHWYQVKRRIGIKRGPD